MRFGKAQDSGMEQEGAGKPDKSRGCAPDAAASERNQDCVRINFCWLPSALAAFCGKALEAGIETEYVRNLLRSYNLFPEKPSVKNEAWPWPVKIFVLGKFELVLDGKAVCFSGKARRKPLQMLKMLVALGGSEVREGELSDLLCTSLLKIESSGEKRPRTHYNGSPRTARGL